MTFTTPTFFLFFFPIFFSAFFILKKRLFASNMLILLANVVFYVWAGLNSVIFLAIYVLVTYFFLNILSKISNQIINKKILLFFCFLLLLPLFFIKYYFILFPNLNLFFPLGLSFFSFQAVSLLVDYYKKEIQTKPSLFEVTAYLTFFITVVSGPITRFNTFSEGFKNRQYNSENLINGINRFIIGFSKKMLLADKLSGITSYYFGGISNSVYASTLGLWIGAISYTLQLYFDFSGYSDMAIGLGKMLGFKIPENFDHPYCAKSISDFWKRWHLSLSKWFKDYIYIPLGGNRCSVPRHLFNMLVVWLFTGIWHGSTWNFVVWGLCYFGLLILEKYCKSFQIFLSTHPIIGHLYSLFFIIMLWVIFNTNNLSSAVRYIGGMFGINTYQIKVEKFTLRVIPYILFSCIFTLPIIDKLKKFDKYKIYSYLRFLLLGFLFICSFAAVLNSNYSPFIYGNF